MPCFIINKFRFNTQDSGSDVPEEPICRPCSWYKKLCIRMIIGLAVCSVPPAVCIAVSTLTNAFCEVLSISILAALIFIASLFFYAKKMDQDLQDPGKNPQGYKYQGRILRRDDPHFLLHLEYYKRHGKWELPDNITPSDYLAEDI